MRWYGNSAVLVSVDSQWRVSGVSPAIERTRVRACPAWSARRDDVWSPICVATVGWAYSGRYEGTTPLRQPAVRTNRALVSRNAGRQSGGYACKKTLEPSRTVRRRESCTATSGAISARRPQWDAITSRTREAWREQPVGEMDGCANNRGTPSCARWRVTSGRIARVWHQQIAHESNRARRTAMIQPQCWWCGRQFSSRSQWRVLELSGVYAEECRDITACWVGHVMSAHPDRGPGCDPTPFPIQVRRWKWWLEISRMNATMGTGVQAAVMNQTGGQAAQMSPNGAVGG